MTREDDWMTPMLDATLKEAVARGVAEGRRIQHELAMDAFTSDSYKLWWAKQGVKPGYLDSYYRLLVLDRLKDLNPGR